MTVTWSPAYPPPEALCGNQGCVFLPRHHGPHSWALPDVRLPQVGGRR